MLTFKNFKSYNEFTQKLPLIGFAPFAPFANRFCFSKEEIERCKVDTMQQTKIDMIRDFERRDLKIQYLPLFYLAEEEDLVVLEARFHVLNGFDISSLKEANL